MSGWRKRQIADGVEKEMTCPPCHGDCNQGRDCPANPPRPESKRIAEWFTDNNAEITWFLIGFLLCDMIDQFIHQHYYIAAWDFFIITVNYLLRKEGFSK